MIRPRACRHPDRAGKAKTLNGHVFRMLGVWTTAREGR